MKLRRNSLLIAVAVACSLALPGLVQAQNYPPSVSQLVEKCMAKSARARYQTAADLASDLEKILSGGRPKIVVEIEDVMARMQEIARDEIAVKKSVARRPAFVVSGALVLVAVAAIVMTMALPEVNESAAASIAFRKSRESSANAISFAASLSIR